MQSAEKLQNQLQSLHSLHGVVRTMKSLAAANIRQCQMAVESLKDYSAAVEMGLQLVLKDLDSEPVIAGAASDRALVAFGSDHGLCGRFNEAIANQILASGKARTSGRQNRIPLLIVGTRLADYFADSATSPVTVDEVLLLPGSTATMTPLVHEVLLQIDRWQTERQVGHVELIGNALMANGSYETRKTLLLPFDAKKIEELKSRPWPSKSLPIYRMPWQQLFSDLLRQYLFVSVFKICAESQEAEHTIRLRTMQEAERNIDEKQASTLGEYRRVRQTLITSELLDILAGFDATGNPEAAQ